MLTLANDASALIRDLTNLLNCAGTLEEINSADGSGRSACGGTTAQSAARSIAPSSRGGTQFQRASWGELLLTSSVTRTSCGPDVNCTREPLPTLRQPSGVTDITSTSRPSICRRIRPPDANAMR